MARAALGGGPQRIMTMQQTKYVLAGGGYCISAPRFPRHQLRPGFIDEVHIFNAEYAPL